MKQLNLYINEKLYHQQVDEKLYHQQVDEKLVINKDIKSGNVYYALLGVYGGWDYLADEIGDTMIAGDKGSGPSIFIVDYKTLLTLDKDYFDDKSITIFRIPEKYQNNIDKFETDYYDGKINLDDDCWELSDDEYNEILNKMKK